MLSVCLLHMGNTAPSGIVLCTGHLRLSVCEWALVCSGLCLMVILTHAPSQCHCLEKCGGTLLHTVPSFSVSLGYFNTSLYFLLHFSLHFFKYLLVIPRKLVITQPVLLLNTQPLCTEMIDPRCQPLIPDYSAVGYQE